MIVKRNRRKHTVTFEDRLQRAAEMARAAADKLPEGPQRDILLKKATQVETAAHINELLAVPPAPASKQQARTSKRGLPANSE